MRSRSLSVCLFTLAATLLFSTVTHAQQLRHETDRVVTAVDIQQRHTLRGHLPEWAVPQTDLGAVNTDIPLDHLTIVLARSAATQAAFEQFLDDQQDPASPRYQQWLTPQQVGENFGLTDHDVNAVIQWLTSQGLRVIAVSPGRTTITFGGASSAVGRALGTEFHRYRVLTRKGEEDRYSIDSEPAVPVALTPVIASFYGLSEQHLEPQSNSVTIPAQTRTVASDSTTITPQFTTTNGSHYIAPVDFVTIFDIQPVYNAGINGAGVKVAVMGTSRVLASDISAFQTSSGLSSTAQPVTIIPPLGTDPGVNGNGEQTLDANRVMSTAPGAETDLVVSGGSSGLTIAIEYEINSLLDPIMTISYGGCEISAGLSGDIFWNSLFSTAAAEGITTFISSGDSAAAGCANDFAAPPVTTPSLSINYICANPYVTCVGGTELADKASPSTYWKSANGAGFSSALSYIPEGAWNEPQNGSNAYQIAGTGGGVSLYITKPSWQTGIGVPADGFRDTPDMALPAAGHDGYYSCLNTSCVGGSFTVFSGTSAAAPGMAGIMALVVQKLGKPQGNFNPTLYRLAAATALGVFHDTTPASSGVAPCSVSTASMCNNSTPSPSALTGGLAGYPLTTGYDLATGWGSVNVANLITAVVTPYVTPTVTVTAAASTIALGGSDNFTVTVTGTPGTPSGTVQLYDGSTTLGNAIPLVSGTATLSGQVFSIDGAHSITAQYSGDTVFVAATSPVFTLTVNPLIPTVILTTSATALLAGQGATLTATVSGSSGMAVGTVTSFANNAILGAATLVNGVATLSVPSFSSIGTYTITAQYSGDTTYAATTSNTVTIVVTPAAGSPYYTLTPAAGTLTIAPGATTGNTYNLTATSVNSFSGTVPLTCTVTYIPSTTTVFNLPACSLAPASVVLTANATAATIITIGTTADHATTSGGNSAKLALAAGGVLACMLLCLPLNSRTRRRRLPLLFALLAMLAIGGLNGCGSGGTPSNGSASHGTALGNYTVTVTGTVSGAATSTSFTLTVN